MDGQNFGVSPGTPGRFDVTKLASILEDVHGRLAGVVIECLPWDKLLARYDRPATFFYLDLPYWGNETDYGEGLFGRMDFEHLAGVLACLKGGWLLSLNDVPGVRRTFARFQIDAVETTYSIAGGNRTAGKVGEVLISPPSKGG